MTPLFWLRRSGRLPVPGPWSALAQPFARALGRVGTRRLWAALLWAAPSWVLEGAVLYLAAQAIGTPLSPIAAIAATAFTILFQVFHLTPGGVGVYEASMTAALAMNGVPAQQGLELALLTHTLKFAYAFTVSPTLALWEVGRLRFPDPLGRWRGSARQIKAATRAEILAARAWNILNEGKPFTPVFVAATFLLLSIPHALDAGYWARSSAAALVLAPLCLIFFRYDFPLRLRAALWAYLAIFFLAFRSIDPAAIAVLLGLYLFFTVFAW